VRECSLCWEYSVCVSVVSFGDFVCESLVVVKNLCESVLNSAPHTIYALM
jgi:hypothetical protein